MTKKTMAHSALVIMTFAFAFYGSRVLSLYVTIKPTSDYLSLIYAYSWWILPSVILTWILFGFYQIPNMLGIRAGLTLGIFFSIITVSPMIISSALIGHMNTELDVLTFLHQTVLAGFMEEILFRGFLFGILFRQLGWGFIPVSISGAIIFGLGHLYQGSTPMEMVGIFAVTAMGAVWFAWLYIEWNNNLWIPIFLHIFMNMSWGLFEVSDNALGGSYTNLFRAITITSTIVITLKMNLKNGLKINTSNLIKNSPDNVK